MPTLLGIPYEKIDGPHVQYDDNSGWTASETVKLLWSNALGFTSALFGAPVVTGGGIWLWTEPAQLAGFPGLVAKSISIDPFDRDAPGLCVAPPSSSHCTFVINFGSIRNDQSPENDDQTRFEHKMSIGGQFMTIPSRGWKWNDGTFAQDDIPLGQMIPTIEHELHWPKVLNPPLAAIRAAMGSTNSATFLGGPPETVLFIGANLSRTVTAQQAKAWDVTYRMSEKTYKEEGTGTIVTWNHFYRSDGAGGGKWDILKSKTGRKVYKSTSFTPIFRV